MTDTRTATDHGSEDPNQTGAAADQPQPNENALDHVWRYFALHAQQRISVFNFFIVLSGILATGIGAGLQVGKAMAPVVAVLGAFLSLFSLVFHRLDARGSELVKLAETALIAGENANLPRYARVVASEAGRRVPGAPPPETWTFGRSFRLIFWVMGVAGAIASGCSIYRWAT